MKQGTTYPIIISVPGIDLSGADWIIVSIKPRMRLPIEISRDENKRTLYMRGVIHDGEVQEKAGSD